jgi:hypothetical protein
MLLEFVNPLNEYPLAFPITECIHIVGFAVSLGTVGVVDLRLLGVGLDEKPAELGRALSIWTALGIATMIMSGMLLFSSDPDRYYLNGAFQLKMICLFLAIVFNYTIHRKVVQANGVSSGSKVVALTSLALWSSVIFFGIFIAFVGNP